MAEQQQDVETLKRRGRRRLVGAIALVLLAVIVLPWVFDPEPRSSAPPVNVRIPGENEAPFKPKPPPAPAPQAEKKSETQYVIAVGAFANAENVLAKLGDLPNYRLPDVSYWKAGIPRGQEAPPTLAAEVRSKDQTLAELRRKCEFLRSAGVETCWLIDSISRSAALFEGATAGRCTETLKADCVPGFERSLRGARRLSPSSTAPSRRSPARDPARR